MTSAGFPSSPAAADGRDLAGALASCLSPESEVRANEPMARHTTLRVGGPADCYVEPASESDLIEVLHFCRVQRLSHLVIGRGSNLIIRDGGVRGVVICLGQPAFNGISLEGERLRCGAGARLKNVANEAKRHGIAGLEFLEGIPGSVGGALRMNAGAMGGAIFDVVETVRLLDDAGEVHEFPRARIAAGYRNCPLFVTSIALGAVLCGAPGDRVAIEERMKEFSRKRWTSQPQAASAGCIFKNPHSIPAGRLIDELGLKGTRLGGAMVSVEHGNFLINSGEATAAEVLALIEIIRRRALAERGISLETEAEIIGEN